ncbi:MAG: 2Fe-2S iron-sulfur cluster-binding protein, partial [Eubacteriales bacterium]|nr:2Fe-2S iron-sulfur cluster-binding protein [Eubacteriales bacterium]
MEQMIPLTIDGVHVEVPAGTTVLEAARQAGVNIPTLCYLKDINQSGNCRMCVVDTGARAFQAACVLPATPNMVVKTNTPALREARKTILELILSNHDKKCLTCSRSQNCELQKLCKDMGVENGDAYAGEMNHYDVEELSPSIVR